MIETSALESTIVEPLTSIELSWSAAFDLRRRATRRTAQIAELFQENTKLAPHNTIAADTETLREARAWAHQTVNTVVDDPVETAELSPALARLVETFTVPGPDADLLFAIDLLIVDDSRILRVLPCRSTLTLEALVGAQDLEVLAPAGCRLTPWTIVLVAAAWRYMAFIGPRGYRRCLLDAGAVCRVMTGRFEKDLEVRTEFVDDMVNRLVLADGVERSAIVVLQPGMSAG